MEGQFWERKEEHYFPHSPLLEPLCVKKPYGRLSINELKSCLFNALIDFIHAPLFN